MGTGRAVQIRDFATDKHRTVDDTPASGGAGMVLKPDVQTRGHRQRGEGRPILAMTPLPITQDRIREIAAGPGVPYCAGGSKASTNASSKAIRRSSRSALPISSCRAERPPRSPYSTLAFACFPA